MPTVYHVIFLSPNCFARALCPQCQALGLTAHLLNRLPEVNRFLRGLRAWVGFKQTGIPYVRPERKFGCTTNSLLKNLKWAQKAIFSFSYAPLDFIAWLALLVVGMAFIGMIFQAVGRIFFPQIVPSGFATLIILILFMGGIQLLCISIIGSYLGHIYDEVKRRPPYIVESILNAPSRKEVEGTGSSGASKEKPIDY